jgi:hypothetical protein
MGAGRGREQRGRARHSDGGELPFGLPDSPSSSKSGATIHWCRASAWWVASRISSRSMIGSAPFTLSRRPSTTAASCRGRPVFRARARRAGTLSGGAQVELRHAQKVAVVEGPTLDRGERRRRGAGDDVLIRDDDRRDGDGPDVAPVPARLP